ncbi:MAG TPA: hypothetical protein VMM58_09370 [Bacteroidota bacterium]|nr:hypothetical protein [Bacteroidota bacterium]
MTLFAFTSLVILSFGVSLFIFPFELFFLFSLILLFGLRYIEKQFTALDREEVRCPVCGHVVNIAHSH